MDNCGCRGKESLEVVTMADSNLDWQSEVVAIRTCLECGRKWTGTIKFRPVEDDYHDEGACKTGCSFDEDSIEDVREETIVGYCKECGRDWWHAFDTEWVSKR